MFSFSHYGRQNCGRGLHNSNQSLLKAFCRAFPEYEWQPWLFQTLCNNSWSDSTLHRPFFDWLAERIGIEHYEQWYDAKHIIEENHRGLLNHYKGSLLTALEAIFPEFEWFAWLFPSAPVGYWDELEHQKKFIDWIASDFGIQQPEEWYKITVGTVNGLGGQGLLSLYGSLPKLLQRFYPDIKWHPWLFEQLPSNFWTDFNNQKDFLTWLQHQLEIKKPEQWSKVTHAIIKQYGGRGLLEFYQNSLPSALQTILPDNQFMERVSNSQLAAWKVLLSLRPDTHMNYRHPQLVHSDSLKNMQLDFFIPSLKLAFEYQGKQHYQNSFRFQENLQQKKRDEEKKTLCKDLGIKLIEIPYWWYGSTRALVSTIHRECPDMLSLFPQRSKNQITKRAPGHWNSLRNQRQLFEDIADELQIESLQDWYKGCSCFN